MFRIPVDVVDEVAWLDLLPVLAQLDGQLDGGEYMWER